MEESKDGPSAVVAGVKIDDGDGKFATRKARVYRALEQVLDGITLDVGLIQPEVARCIVLEAMKARGVCNACKETRGCCLRPGTDIFKYNLEKVKHESFQGETFGNLSKETTSFLRSTVHFMVNLQQMASENWFVATRERMATHFPSWDSKGWDADVAMSELIMFCATAAATASFSLCMDEELPLDNVVERTNYFNFVNEKFSDPNQFCKRVAPHNKVILKTWANVPHQIKSGEPMNSICGGKDGRTHVVEGTKDMVPLHPLMLSPLRGIQYSRFQAAFYVSIKEFFNTGYIGNRCLERSQMEVVASAYAGALGCAY
mmetsp:Transcript_11250/g.18371  ORF Transcript_11250/g.18371 Transcript_11250/m.18371 type:complete len:317 (-) Transcript_11250:947-1897(-)